MEQIFNLEWSTYYVDNIDRLIQQTEDFIQGIIFYHERYQILETPYCLQWIQRRFAKKELKTFIMYILRSLQNVIPEIVVLTYRKKIEQQWGIGMKTVKEPATFLLMLRDFRKCFRERDLRIDSRYRNIKLHIYPWNSRLTVFMLRVGNTWIINTREPFRVCGRKLLIEHLHRWVLTSNKEIRNVIRQYNMERLLDRILLPNNTFIPQGLIAQYLFKKPFNGNPIVHVEDIKYYI
jgi:hypothetical protein